MIQFDHGVCHDLAAATSREWLETNGLGGFASSTIIGLNTRRYHGLLTAATKPPVGRFVLLSKLEETVVIRDDRVDLSSNQYPGTIHPRGFEYQQEFRLDPFPVFTYRIGELVIEKSVFMLHGENTVVVQYRASEDCRLEVRPLIAFRDFHSTTHENSAINGKVKFGPGQASITPYPGLPTLYLSHNGAEAELASDWYHNFEYCEERNRGLDFHEDLYHPLTLTFDLTSKLTAAVIASTAQHDAADAQVYERYECSRRSKISASAPVHDDFVQTLTLAADQFIAQRGSLKTIIAGYHWFGDWGRDTMIALPGLTLVTGHHTIARDILLAFAKHVDQGMLPNIFPDAGDTPEYNTVDATLWYFEAVRQYVEYSKDFDLVQDQLYSVLADIIDCHLRGTRYGIKVDPQDGLLRAGEPGVQLTWMDAKVGDWVVTPRIGKPVEIQALWYNALRTMECFATHFGNTDSATRYADLAARTHASFNGEFWYGLGQYLFDVVDGHGDASLRPNQVIATSLKYSMLSSERARLVLNKVEQHLLTPFGLRTLPPGDSRYMRSYGGDTLRRDSAYHQGTVWPWLLGPFVSGYVKTFGRNKDTVKKVQGWLEPLQVHLTQAGLGSISEIFCAEAPHTPCGCIAQAWSVAEVLRALVEDVHGIRPAVVPAKQAAAAPRQVKIG
jgi:predicted glycogen debranching enzyme